MYQTSNENNLLIPILQNLASIGIFVMTCKYLSLFFGRKNDSIPFLMSENWMIFAIAISAFAIISSIISVIARCTKTNKTNEDFRSLFVGIIAFSVSLVTLIPFSLFLAKAISQEKIIQITKILSIINVVGFFIMIGVISLTVLCCCVVCCCRRDAAAQSNDSKFSISENFAGVQFTDGKDESQNESKDAFKDIFKEEFNENNLKDNKNNLENTDDSKKLLSQDNTPNSNGQEIFTSEEKNDKKIKNPLNIENFNSLEELSFAFPLA